MTEFVDHPPVKIGGGAPRFQARSTMGFFDLADLRGEWVLLFAHPADFTPVCTSELIALARSAKDFDKRGCTLVGVSVDSLYSHLAWVRTIHDIANVKVEFPLVEDPTLEIARAYGMIGAEDVDAGGVRWTYVIDPEGTIRASLCYPAEVGRSVPELLRLIDALQASDETGALAPADWQGGEAMLEAVREDVADVLESAGPGDWFYRRTDAK